MTEHLHGIASEAEDLVRLQSGDLVVDIGCNDGTLLDGYRTESLELLGFDPSNVAAYAEEKGYDVVRDFYSPDTLESLYSGRKARVITTIAMLYDLENPRDIVAGIARNLADDGVWVIELHYLATMLERNSFDAICHEHLEYYSLAVLERVLSEVGLEVVAGSLNDVNGGSIRLLVGHRGRLTAGSEGKRTIQELRVSEFENALDSSAPYERFSANVERVRTDLVDTITRLRRESQRIHVYGASTKGNTILQYAGIGRDEIECAAERNPDKWGSETVATGIPIVSEEESRAKEPDYYLVLPWHFMDEFLDREREFLERGGKFIAPLPEVAIIDKNGAPPLPAAHTT
jgi:NDP-4-keto-2,6-dideoxyhexose 3-C-methyltransferase